MISPAAVTVIAELVDSMDPNAPRTHDLVVDASDYAADHTPSQTREWLSRRVVAADPEDAARRRRRAFANRKVVFSPGADSMTSLWALLPGVQARQIYDTVNAVALAGGREDARTMDQRRADALVDLVVGRAEPPQVNVQVFAPVATLAGVGDEPAEVVGVGPVRKPAECGPECGTGSVECASTLDCGRKHPGPHSASFEASPYSAQSVEARDVVCRFPGCRRKAAKSGTDLDHTVPWPAGPTSVHNLAVLCRRHHRLKHSPGWQVQLDVDGVMTWTTPEGKTFMTTPWLYSDPRGP